MSTAQFQYFSGIYAEGDTFGFRCYTIIDWCSFMRHVKSTLLDTPKNSGFDENDQFLLVEIDESKFFHQK